MHLGVKSVRFLKSGIISDIHRLPTEQPSRQEQDWQYLRCVSMGRLLLIEVLFLVRLGIWRFLSA